jgi:hypothetical protein
MRSPIFLRRRFILKASMGGILARPNSQSRLGGRPYSAISSPAYCVVRRWYLQHRSVLTWLFSHRAVDNLNELTSREQKGNFDTQLRINQD